MVTQDTSLLHRSVRENIMFGNRSDRRRNDRCSQKKLEAYEFILKLRDVAGRTGYDAHVESGATLSGGQRQRIAICGS